MKLELTGTAEGGYLLGAGVYDGLSARIASLVGFDALWLSSFSVSASMGVPDINLVTHEQMAARCAAISTVSALPIVVDIDNGGGATPNAVRAAQVLAASGAAAVCIEDAVFPKRCSFYDVDDRRLVDIDEAAQRVREIKRRVPDIAVIARTEALVAELGVSEAVKRAIEYTDANADAVFIQVPTGGLAWFDECLELLDSRVPIVVTPTGLAALSARDLVERGVQLIIHANAAIRSVAATMTHVLGELSDPDRSLDGVAEQLFTMRELGQVTGVDDWLAMEGLTR